MKFLFLFIASFMMMSCSEDFDPNAYTKKDIPSVTPPVDPPQDTTLANGQNCTTDTQCKSNYCYPGPGQNRYCVAADKNCAKPGSDGVMWDDEYKYNNRYYKCVQGSGVQPIACEGSSWVYPELPSGTAIKCTNGFVEDYSSQNLITAGTCSTCHHKGYKCDLTVLSSGSYKVKCHHDDWASTPEKVSAADEANLWPDGKYLSPTETYDPSRLKCLAKSENYGQAFDTGLYEEPKDSFGAYFWNGQPAAKVIFDQKHGMWTLVSYSRDNNHNAPGDYWHGCNAGGWNTNPTPDPDR